MKHRRKVGRTRRPFASLAPFSPLGLAGFAILAGVIALGSLGGFVERARAQVGDAGSADAGGTPGRPAPALPEGAQSLVFVPYDDATGIGSEPSRSVLLPYADFLQLKGARPTPGPDFKPAAAIASARYDGDARLSGEVARFEAEIVVEAIARPTDALEIRLPFGDVALESVSVEGQDATVAPPVEGDASGPGLSLHVRGEGRRTVRAVFSARVSRSGDQRELAFSPPRAAASSVTLLSNRAIEAVDRPDAAPATVERNDGADGDAPEWTLRTSTNAQGRAVLAWREPAAGEAPGAAARIAVTQNLQVLLGAGSASGTLAIMAEPLSGAADSLRATLPPGVRVFGCEGELVRAWNESAPSEEGGTPAHPDASPADSSTTRTLTISLSRAVSEPFSATLQFEVALAPPGADGVTLAEIPRVVFPDAARDAGEIVVRDEAEATIWPEVVEGLEPVGSPDAGVRAWRFSRADRRLVLSRRPVAPRVFATGDILYEVGEEFVRLRALHALDVRERGVQTLSLGVPEGFELLEVGPPDVVAGSRVREGSLEINLAGERMGSFQISTRFQRARAADETPLKLHPVPLAGAEEETGRVNLATIPALQTNQVEIAGLEPDVFRTMQPVELTPASGYRYHAPRFSATFAVERRKPRVTCETSLLASLNPSHVSLRADLGYLVEFGAEDEFRFLTPARAGEDVRIEAAGGIEIREKSRETPKDGDEYATWTVRLRTPQLGAVPLSVSFDDPLPEADAGAGGEVSLELPRVRTVGAARETGHVAVSRGENLEVRVTNSDGLEARDAKELPPALRAAYLGFRYVDPKRWTLALELVRHDLVDVLGALVRRMHVETVLSDQREATHEVTFEVQNNREQYLELELPEGMEIWSAFVQGRPVRPTKRESDGVRLIELARSESIGSAFRVRAVLRQTLPGGALGRWGDLAFHPPAPLNLPVLRFTWKLYLPRDYEYLKFDGTLRRDDRGTPAFFEPAAELLMTDLPAEFVGGPPRDLARAPEARPDAGYDPTETEAERQARLQGAALEIALVREGRQFVFSKLTDASVADSIEIRYMKRKPLLILQGAIALVVIAGLWFAMRRSRNAGWGFAAAAGCFVAASLAEGLGGRLALTGFAASMGALGLEMCARFVGAARAAASASRDALAHAAEERRIEETLRRESRARTTPPAWTGAGSGTKVETGGGDATLGGEATKSPETRSETPRSREERNGAPGDPVESVAVAVGESVAEAVKSDSATESELALASEPASESELAEPVAPETRAPESGDAPDPAPELAAPELPIPPDPSGGAAGPSGEGARKKPRGGPSGRGRKG